MLMIQPVLDGMYAMFRFQPYLSLINIEKVCVSLSGVKSFGLQTRN